ncbi:hypothetical protein IT400_00240 [Candidatus Nomurabacteria bacterium]|nr:hypothetical protein [Candidatus Nomurabacteria bacterium]
MSNQYQQKIIGAITLIMFIFSVILTPFKYALAGIYDPTGIDLAQYEINNSSTKPEQESQEQYLSDTNSYKLNTASITGAMSSVIGCTGIVNKIDRQLSSFFNSSFLDKLGVKDPREGSAGAGGTTGGDAKVEGTTGGDAGSGPRAGDSGTNGVTVTDSGTDAAGGSNTKKENDTSVLGGQIMADTQNVPIKTDKPTADAAKKTQEQTQELKITERQNKLRDDCLNGIAYTLAKQQLAKMTQVTINWINSGFNGNPLYIYDRESYFQSIADEQLLNLIKPLANITNKDIYPYGRNIARSIINSAKSTFEQSSQSTLRKFLKENKTEEDFANDFSSGGWDGWFALTQQDQNNPLGFGIMTSQKLADQISKKIDNVKAELTEGKGFMSQKECAEYEKDSTYKASDPGDISGYAGNRTADGSKTRRCIRYKVVTPGSIISDQISTVLSSNIRQLELADSLNESLSSVFQALINQMVNQGLSNLSSFSPNNAPKTLGAEGINKLYDSLGNNITNLDVDGTTGTVLSVKKGNGWYSSGNTFNITTDLGDIMKYDPITKKRYVYKKGIISTQKDYAEAVKLSLKKIADIMPALGELDYCIPGPTPSWEIQAKYSINYIIEYLQNLFFANGAVFEGLKDPLEGNSVAQIYATINPIFGMVQSIGSFFRAKYNESMYEQYQKRMEAKEKKFEEDRKAAIVKQKDTFGWYKDRIDQLYGPTSMMRTPSEQLGYYNPWYLPMAEVGLESTKYIRVYDDNIITAKKEYKELIEQANVNVYKLNIIKTKVNKIINAARNRQIEEDMKKGIPAIDPSCYDYTGIEDGPNKNYGVAPDGGGMAPGPGTNTNGTTNNPGNSNQTYDTPHNNANTATGINADFKITTIENKNDCELTIKAQNISSGNIKDNIWGIKIGSGQTVYSKNTKDYTDTFSTFSQYGNSILTLTIKDSAGNTESKSQSITIPKRTTTSNGKICPQ